MTEDNAKAKMLGMRAERFIADSSVILAAAQVLSDGNRLVSELVQLVNAQAEEIRRLKADG